MTVALATARDLEATDQDDRPLADALERAGVEVVVVPWDEPRDWAADDLVVIRSTWDYTHRLDEFLDWARTVDAATTLWNPFEVVRWNTHKGYLIELEERGAPVVPTAWLGQGDRIDLAALLDSRGWKDVVAKPAIGAGSRGLVRIGSGMVELGQHHLDALLARGDVMVQPYQSAVETSGETSVVFIDGELSHAVRKVPAAGEIRIQVDFGGRYERIEPDRETARLAAWVLEATGHEFLYARVDLLPDSAGQPQLAELEVVEPSLYLTWVPEAADRLAGAIARRL